MKGSLFLRITGWLGCFLLGMIVLLILIAQLSPIGWRLIKEDLGYAQYFFWHQRAL